MIGNIKSSPELLAALERAKAWMDSLTPEEREAHFAEQRRAWVESEMKWDEDATVVVVQPS